MARAPRKPKVTPSEVVEAYQYGADEATRADLSETERTEYLDRADRLYREMIESDDNSDGRTLLMVTAHTGRAVVAESRGDDAKAKEHYEAAAARAGENYPELAAQSRARGEQVGKHQVAASMPSEEAVQALQPKTPETGESVQVEPWIRELIDAGKPETPATGG